MKKARIILFILSILIVGGGVFFGAQQLAGNFLATSDEGGQVGDCPKPGTAHTVTITNDKVDPVRTNAQRCDTLTIINHDNKVRDMAFGVHDKHITYDGVTQRTLAKDQSFTVTLNQPGTYLFHDHYQEFVGGDFTVQ